MYISLFFYFFIIHYLLPPTWGLNTLCYEMSYSKRETKLKKEKKRNFLFYILQVIASATDRFPPFKGFIQLWQPTTMASCQGQGFILWAIPHAFSFTTPHHSLLSCTILLACLTFKPLSLKQSSQHRSMFDGSDMWRGWRGIGLGLQREFVQESMQVVIQWVGHRRDGLIP